MRNDEETIIKKKNKSESNSESYDGRFKLKTHMPTY